MATDIQFILPQELVTLSSATIVPNVSPPILDVRGDDFRSVIEVTVNEIQSLNFMIVEKTRMFVQVPAAAAFTKLESIKVFSSTLTLSKRSVLKTQFPRSPGVVTGMQRLVQLYIKTLLQTPGSDIFEPEIGGGALRTLSQSYPASRVGSVIADFSICIDQTNSQIIGMQAREPGLALNEKLLTCKIESHTLDNKNMALYIGLFLQAQDGRIARPFLVT